MEKNSADSPLDQAIEQYKRDLMAVYRRSPDFGTARRAIVGAAADPFRPGTAAQRIPPAPTHGPDLSGQEPEKSR